MPSALFLDRDGTLIEDTGFVASPESVRLLSGVPDALRRARAAGFVPVVVTNQSGLARGFFDLATAEAIDARLAALLAAENAPLGGSFRCPHLPPDELGRPPDWLDQAVVRDARPVAEWVIPCLCRKPRPGLLQQAATKLGLDLRTSVTVGDSLRDVQAGKAAGTRTALVLTGKGRASALALAGLAPDALARVQPDCVAATLGEVVDWILAGGPV